MATYDVGFSKHAVLVPHEVDTINFDYGGSNIPASYGNQNVRWYVVNRHAAAPLYFDFNYPNSPPRTDITPGADNTFIVPAGVSMTMDSVVVALTQITLVSDQAVPYSVMVYV